MMPKSDCEDRGDGDGDGGQTKNRNPRTGIEGSSCTPDIKKRGDKLAVSGPPESCNNMYSFNAAVCPMLLIVTTSSR